MVQRPTPSTATNTLAEMIGELQMRRDAVAKELSILQAQIDILQRLAEKVQSPDMNNTAAFRTAFNAKCSCSAGLDAIHVASSQPDVIAHFGDTAFVAQAKLGAKDAVLNFVKHHPGSTRQEIIEGVRDHIKTKTQNVERLAGVVVYQLFRDGELKRHQAESGRKVYHIKQE